MKYFLLIWMLCPLASLHAAGPGIRIACYNAESLHDTIPDRLIDDLSLIHISEPTRPY